MYSVRLKQSQAVPKRSCGPGSYSVAFCAVRLHAVSVCSAPLPQTQLGHHSSLCGAIAGDATLELGITFFVVVVITAVVSFSFSSLFFCLIRWLETFESNCFFRSKLALRPSLLLQSRVSGSWWLRAIFSGVRRILLIALCADGHAAHFKVITKSTCMLSRQVTP